MRIFHDEDEWETVVTSRPCTSCNGDLKKCNGGCNGMCGISAVRRAPEEVRKIKEKRRREHEDAILAEAEAIKSQRSAAA